MKLALTVAILSLSIALPAARADTPAQPITPEQLRTMLQTERGKVLVVNLWATWCRPCLKEVPDLLALEAEMSASKVKLIGIAIDEPTPGAVEVERFRKKYFPQFVTYARTDGELDALASVIDPAWNEVVPTTYIIDRTGKVRTRIQGKKSLEEFKAAVAAVL